MEGSDSLDVPGLEAGEELDKYIAYGDIAEYCGKYGTGSQAIGFAPTANIASKCVDMLNGRGFNFKLIHREMPLSQRNLLIDQLKSGEANGLVNAQLLAYGFNVPVVSYAFSVRYIKSRPLWVQMAGRIIRGHPGKEKSVFADHTGTIHNFAGDGKGGTYGRKAAPISLKTGT